MAISDAGRDGAAGHDNGLVEIHFGNNPSGPPPIFFPSMVLVDPSPQAGGRFGTWMVSGDLDGNANADLVIGVPGYNVGGHVGAGKIYVHKF